MESNFYAWRATGNTKYLDNAAAFVKKIPEILRIQAERPALPASSMSTIKLLATSTTPRGRRTSPRDDSLADNYSLQLLLR